MKARLRPIRWVIVAGVVVAVAACVYGVLVARSRFAGAAPQPSVTVLEVIRDDGLYEGTAFKVDAGWVTARHVLQGALVAHLVQSGERRAAVATILADDPVHDVVVFDIEGSSRSTALALPVARGAAGALRVGSSMRIVGPGMKDAGVALKGFQEMPPYGQLLEFSAAGEPGWSGGPVLTESGEVIAIIRQGRADGIRASPIDHALRGVSAAVSFDDWTRQPPPLPVKVRAAFERGVNAEVEGRIDEALAGYAEAISLEDDFAMARTRRAGIFFKLRRLADAAADLTAAMAAGAKDDPELYLRRMTVAEEMRDCDALADSFRELGRIRPGRDDMLLPYAESLLKGGCVDEALASLLPLQQSPHISDEGVLLLAESLIRSGNAPSALDLLNKHNVDLPRAKLLTVIAAIIGQGGEGVGSLQELLQPRSRVSSRALLIAREAAAIAVARVMSARLAEAMVPPWSSPEAAHLRGTIQRNAGDIEGAILSFHAALELAPDFWPSLGELARTEAANGRLELAIAHAESAVSMSDGDVDARLNLASQLSDAGLYDRADAQARVVIEKDDRHSRAWEILGQNAFRQGHNDDARAHYSKAVSIAPGDLALRRRYAKWLMTTGSHQAAVREITEMRTMSPAHRETVVLLAEALLEAGDRDSSLAATEDAARLMVADDLALIARVVRLLCGMGRDDAARALVHRLGLEDRVAQQMLAESGCTK